MMWAEWANHLHEITIWILLVLSVLSVTIMLDRWIFLSRFKTENEEVLSEILKSLESGRNSHLKLVYDRYMSLEAGGVLKKAWEHIVSRKKNGLEELIQSHLLATRPHLEKRVWILASLGSNSPFIGLLGTIFGVMEAFDGLNTATGSMEDVLSGISKALFATALGLIVAIPAITAYNYLQKLLKSIFQQQISMKEALLAFDKTCDKREKTYS